MGKISPVSAKYIVHAFIQIEGVVEKPDVIGAVFGQTEGLLGSELELRELQRSGRIGRIDVDIEVKNGKSQGYIIVPSSLDKAETSLIAAAVETIQRIGPCDAKVKVEKIEDVRVNKRSFVLDRAKELLKSMNDDVLPDSQEITDQVSTSVMMAGIIEYGPDRLPAGPDVGTADELILVEGRADVLALLKNGFNNVIAMNGTSMPASIKDLCKGKSITIFVDGDRGGDLIIKELSGIADIDFVAKAPDGKEVEELAKKEIHKALRGKIPFEQFKTENTHSATQHFERNEYPRRQPTQRYGSNNTGYSSNSYNRPRPSFSGNYERRGFDRGPRQEFVRTNNFRRGIGSEEKAMFKKMSDELIGTHGSCILDSSKNLLGKVPVTELEATLRSLRSGVYAVIIDGIITPELASIAERVRVRYLVGNSSKVSPEETRVSIILSSELQ